jgi:hypothetical protein
MLGLSVGMVFLGNIQDKHVASQLTMHQPALASAYLGEEKGSVFGKYQALDQTKLVEASPAEKETISSVQAGAKKNALSTAAVFPVIMLLCYLALILHFRARGGYRSEHLAAVPAPART